MNASARTALVADLMARVATIEGRIAAGVVRSDSRRVPTGWPEADAALGGGLPRHGLHEWLMDDDGSAERRAPMQVLIHLAWQALLHDEQHQPGAGRRVLWIGRAVWPQGHALVRGLRVGAQALFGARCPRLWPDARLVRRSMLVATPECDVGARVWAIEQAVRCPGVCAVIADGAGLGLAATRRLQLAAAEALLLVARPREQRPTLSAASTRWRVRGDPAGLPWTMAHAHSMAARLPSEPACMVEMQRNKGGEVVRTGAATRVTHAWQWQGVEQPPKPIVAEAERRRRKKEARLAARAAQAAQQRRREECEPHDAAASYPMPVDPAVLPGHHASGMAGVVRRPRRARRAR